MKQLRISMMIKDKRGDLAGTLIADSLRELADTLEGKEECDFQLGDSFEAMETGETIYIKVTDK